MDYYRNVKRVMDFLKEKRVCSSSRSSHEECYRTFAEYMSLNGLIYSDKAVRQWLVAIKEIHTWQRCYFWNQYMLQLKEMSSSGTISDRYLYQIVPAYKKVPGSLRLYLDEYLDSYRHNYTKNSFRLARIYCSDIMLFFNDAGLSRIEDIKYQDVLNLYNAELFCADDTKSILLGHAARMMTYFSRKGLCDRGYAMLLNAQIYPYVGSIKCFSKNRQKAIAQLRTQSLDFPADELYDSISDYINTLDDYGYVGCTLYLARHSLTALYLFLKIHNLGYLPEIAWMWFSEIKNNIGVSWKHWRRILKLYEEYTETGDISAHKKYSYEPSSLVLLPEWCKEPILAFMRQKLREFRSDETARKYQYPCIRFCHYLINCSISSFADITPAVINKFSQTDKHSTFKGRSSYFTVIRGFLEHLEEKGFIENKSLHNALSTGTAPIEKIVDILTDEQIKRIYDYRISHTKPIELRNTAMVIIGLRMGLRASDVTNLKLIDIDWKKKLITIVQKKTWVKLALPMPIIVGNSIYMYLRDGRPKAGSEYIFIRHKAPYSKLTTKKCTIALHDMLPERKSVIGGDFMF